MKYYVCIKGRIERLLDEESCMVTRSKRKALKYCEDHQHERDIWGIVSIEADRGEPERKVKRKAMLGMWE